MAGAGYLLAALVFYPSPLLPSERTVPRTMGVAADQAVQMLRKAGLKDEIADSEPHPFYPAGTVIWQDPVPGVAVPRGTIVALTVSTGKPRVAVPDVRGLDVALAQRLLLSAGVQVSGTDSVGSDYPVGVAAGTDPPAGDSVVAGSGVLLHLAKGTK